MVVLTLVAAIVARPGMARPEPGPGAGPGGRSACVGLALLGVASLRMVGPFQVAGRPEGHLPGGGRGLRRLALPAQPRRSGTGSSRILMVAGAVTAAWGLVQQAHRDREPCATWATGTTRPSGSAASFMRSFSTFLQPFPFAFFLMIVVLVGIPIALNDPARLRNRVFLFLLPLYGLGMLVAVVRGAWIGTAVGTALAGHPPPPHPPAGHPDRGDRAARSGRAPRGRTRPRPPRASPGQTWTDNLYEIGDHPFGIGIGTAGAAARQDQRAGGRSSAGTSSRGRAATAAYQPDNQYFLFTLELGLAGLLVLPALPRIAAFRTAVEHQRTDGRGGLCVRAGHRAR